VYHPRLAVDNVYIDVDDVYIRLHTARMKRLILALAILAGCAPLRQLVAANPAWKKMDGAPSDYGLAAERVTFRADGLNIVGWYIHASAVPRATVIACAGRGGNKSTMLPRAKMLADAGYDVLAIDLRGHGESEGTYPSGGYKEKAEIRAAVAFAKQRGSRRIVMLGHSVGGVAVLHAAVDADPAVVGVIADGAFITAFDMMRRVRETGTYRPRSTGERIGMWIASEPTLGGFMRIAMWFAAGTDLDPDGGNLIRVLPKIAIPVLFVSGDRDVISPTRNAWNMRFLVPGNRGEVAVLHAGHQTFEDAQLAYTAAVLGFLERTTASSAVVARTPR
jgi:pimeloyl-ACP methyl ester carboxylesterase